MAVRVFGAAFLGIDAVPIEVEVDLLKGLPRVSVVGLPTNAVKESTERIRSSLVAGGGQIPNGRVVVNLAPADLPKEGTGLDLPTALGMLAIDKKIPPAALSNLIVVGELSLSGKIRPCRGALSLAILARDRGLTLVLPRASASMAALVPGVSILAVDSLTDLVAILNCELLPKPPSKPVDTMPSFGADLRDVRGQQRARRALEISAAGAHHLLMMGPPGCGKTMLASRMPSLLPKLSFHEVLQTSRIHDAAGLLNGCDLLTRRPFRAPHYTVSLAGLAGGASLWPGEVSLAHNGVLSLDEAPEFKRTALEALRTPLEDGVVRISSARGTVSYPANLTLIVACNPCPCGHRGSRKPCQCTDFEVMRYRRKLSGPILDRIDIHVELGEVEPAQLLTEPPGESSEEVRDRVCRARELRRCRESNAVPSESEMRHPSLDDSLSIEAKDLLFEAARVHGLSARSTVRLMRVARTIADLAENEQVEVDHIAEALSFRPCSVVV